MAVLAAFNKPVFAGSVDYDGDGVPDAYYDSTPNIPQPSTPTPAHRQSSSNAVQRYSASAQSVPHARAIDTNAMIGQTMAGSILQGFFNEALNPAPEPSGPTPEQIRQMEEQRILAEQRHQEFLRSNTELSGKLKGTGHTYVQNNNISDTGGLKLKTITQTQGNAAETYSGFFGQPGSAQPTVALLREPVMEQVEFENQKQLIEQRIEEPNKWCSGIHASLMGKVPPLPYKKFNELQPGDVLLIEASGASVVINKTDNLLSGDKISNSSHTVLYLKKVNGVKHFLENIPGEGPRIIFEDEFLKRYGSRGAQVANLAQPLNKKEAERLYAAAVEMAQKNRKEIANNFRGWKWLGTNYGAWGKDNMVCSEADWALLKTAGRKIPKSGDRTKVGMGIDFSPADFFSNGQYFLVSPLEMPK